MRRFALRSLFALLLVGAAAGAAAAPDGTSAPPSATGTAGPDAVIYPAGSPTKPAAAEAPGGWSRAPWLGGALALAAAGVWWFWRLRLRTGAAALAGRKLTLEETRSLGNRQYLVVAAYGDKRLLLGVTPGRIQMLCELEADDEEDLS